MSFADICARVVFVLGFTLLGAGAFGVVMPACSSTPTPQSEKAAGEFCVARAVYVLANVATGSTLDPEPGSPRAKLEAAEDRFCRARERDAGP